MAHLEGRNRAQMILLIGFTLAVVFVSLAVLLNSVIYTENLATRSEASRTSHAVTVADDVERGMVGVIGYANEHNTSSYSVVEGELEDGTGNVEQLLNRQQIAKGAVVKVRYDSFGRATWINQSYEADNFTDDDGQSSWDLVSDQDGVRQFRMNITDRSGLGTTGVADPTNFTVVAKNSSGDTWEMKIYHDNLGTIDEVADPYIVEVEDGDGDTRYCGVGDNEAFWINVSAGTVAGEECRALRFGEDVSDVESIRYENAENVSGTYRLLVNNESSSDIPEDNYNETGDPPPPPILSAAAWNATVHVEYQTRTLTFETDVQARPGDEDA